MDKSAGLKDFAFFLTFVAALGGFFYWQSEQAREQREQEVRQARTDLTRMTMQQSVAHCRALWITWHYDQLPLAVAWHTQGVDWYVIDGVDTTSMRHFACDGSAVTTGARYERVMNRLVPPPTGESRSILNDRNLFEYLAGLPDPGASAKNAADAISAIEVTEHPVTRELVERRWLMT